MVDSVLDSISLDMERILTKYNDDNAAIAAWEAGLDVLEHVSSGNATKLIWMQKCHSNLIATHPTNRGGLGLVAAVSEQLGAKHCRAGWSYRKASESNFAVQANPDPEKLAVVLEANRKMELQQGKIPPLAGCVQVAIGGTHTNGFLRMIEGKVRSALISIAPHGVLDPEFLARQHPGIGQALREGLDWKLLHYKVEERWPQFINIGCKALNAKGMTDVSETEGICTIAAGAMVESDRNVAVDWEKHRAEACISEPFWQGWANTLVALCEVVPASQIFELADQVRALCGADGMGHLGGAYIHKIVGLKWPGVLVQHSRLKTAAWIANLLSPVEKVEDGKCKLLSPNADLSKLVAKDNTKLVADAEFMMDQSRALCTHLPGDKAWVPAATGRPDCRIIYFICDKGIQSMEGHSYPSLFAIGEKFLEEVLQHTGTKPKCPWSHLRSAGKSKIAPITTDEGPSVQLETFAQVKDPVYQLSKIGFVVGATIKAKADNKSLFRIEKIAAGKVTASTFEKRAEVSTVQVPFADVTKLYGLYTGKIQNCIADFRGMLPTDTDHWQIDATRAQLQLALHFLWGKYSHMCSADMLEVYTSPSETKVAVEFDKGSLRLVPATRTISVRKATKKASEHAVDLGAVLQPPCVEEALYSALEKHFSTKTGEHDVAWIAPFWNIPRVANAENANMKLEFEQVSINSLNDGKQNAITVAIPVMCNTKKLNIGDVLSCQSVLQPTNKRPATVTKGTRGKNLGSEPRPLAARPAEVAVQ